ncbi:unnamed protein product [Gongylonema pulchrum]|uniref:U24 n=1 Tax=Gongylonema pulchrum TaxID=637853 RepID=A0A183D034_9BILA|nr:unnamed protein product [Gongylonema pulchrum]
MAGAGFRSHIIQLLRAFVCTCLVKTGFNQEYPLAIAPRSAETKEFVNITLLQFSVQENTTNKAGFQKAEEVDSTHYPSNTIWTPSRKLATEEVRRKLLFFWITVAVIIVLWILILIATSAIVYIRIVHMHHTFSQIFCPKD